MPALLIVLLLLAAPDFAVAQTAAKSRFVILRGADTVATEDLDRTDTEIRGRLAFHGTKTSEIYRAVVAPDATIPLIEVTVSEAPNSSAERARVEQRARVIFRNDSVAIDDISGHGAQTRIFPTEVGALPYLNLSFGLLEQAIRRATVLGKDSVKVAFFNLSSSKTKAAGATAVGTIARFAADSIALDLGEVEFRLRVDAQGRLTGGGIPAQQLSIERR
jgi:hypothetical protein